MKYLIISDIHGSSYYLKMILNKESFDYLILLGDILPHGPRNDLPYGYNPKEVISILNPIASKIIAVRGNCDAYVDDMVLDFELSDSSSLLYNNKMIFMTHGHNHKAFTKQNCVIFCGHTHISEIRYVDSNLVINPGSCSIPKDSHKSYAILENNIIQIKDVETSTILNSIDLGEKHE